MKRYERPGGAARPLSELSDEELERELVRRRRARADRGAPPAERAAPPRRRDREPEPRPASPQHKQLRQYYANLELEPGASLDDIRRAYRELMRKYHPDQHVDDPERHRAAVELAQSLTAAYRALREHLSKK